MNKDFRKFDEFISGAALLCLSVFYLYNSFSIRTNSLEDFNAASFPKGLGLALMVLSVAQMVSGVLRLRRVGQNNSAETQVPANGGNALCVFITLAALAVYIALMKIVGFFPMTVIYVAAQTLILVPSAKRNIRLVALISVVFSVGVYTGFVYGFQLMLPQGIMWF